ncbi:MAG: nuclear transport factor 2 family protein [Bacteroidota bacterium]
MTEAASIVHRFYDALKAKDFKTIENLYHEQVVFNDPVFSHLNHRSVLAMWKMLLENDNSLFIEYHSVKIDRQVATCIWEARYNFSKKQLPVHNVIHTKMILKDERILKHTDSFALWKWSKMALGFPGKLFGWTPLMQNRIRSTARRALEKYMQKRL